MCNGNGNGIYLVGSNNTTITGNTCNGNGNGDGIYLSGNSNNNTITGNTCNDNSGGIYLASTNNNTITGNTCNDNNYGIHLASTNNNTITGNTCIRGTGQSSDYTTLQYTIRTRNSNYNLIAYNNTMGKDVVIEGGISNTSAGNKYS